MNTTLRLVAVALSLLFAACNSTRLVLVDDAYGFEHLSGEHGMHLATPHAVLDREPADAGSTGVSYRFMLDLRCQNGRNEAWEVQRDGFECRSAPCPGVSLHVATTSTQLISVPPRGEARLQVPIVIHTDGSDLYGLEHAPIVVVFKDADGHVLLDKRLLVGDFNLGWQVGRFAGVLSGALVLAFLL